jgi:outer membrane protein assembly factor BamA
LTAVGTAFIWTLVPAMVSMPLPSADPAAEVAWTQAATQNEVIAEVRVHGNHLTPDDELVALAGIVIGAPFESRTIADITNRLRQTGRFDEIDVRKRFASIADPTQIVLVLVVNEGPVRIDLPSGPDEAVRVVPRRGLRNLMYMPILDAEDGYGFTYGARVAYVGFAGEKSRLSFPLTWGGLKQAGVEFDRVFDAGPLSRVEVGGRLQRQRNPAFDEQDTRRRVWARAESAVGPVRFGGGAGWQRVSFADADEDLRTATFDVTLDTRLSPVHPRNAVYGRAALEHINFASGGEVQRLTLDGRGYIGLVGQSVLVLRAASADANQSLPPYLKSLLGGWSSLRGFKAGAFVGDTMVTGSIELEIPLNATLSIGKVGVSLFVDAGAVHDRGERLRDATVHSGGGGSVWFTLTAFKMSLSVARGRGAGTRVNFGGGFVF